jgi:hypothetical protein
METPLAKAVGVFKDWGMKGVWKSALILAVGILWSGCHATKVTEPQRSVTEQFLLSSAAERAVAQVDLSVLKGRKVFVQERYFKGYDEAFAIGAIRERISKAGALMMGQEAAADVIVEIRSGGLGLDTRESLVGIPALNMPIPLTGPVSTPEIALYKSAKADSAGKFALFAYERVSGEHVHSTGPMAGTGFFHHYRFLGLLNWRSTDVPELDPKLRKRLRK